MSRPGRARIGLLALVTAVAWLLPATAPARAASVTFGRPTVEATYDQSIAFSVELTSDTPVERVELWLRMPGSIGPYVVAVDDPGGTTRTLHYLMDLTGSGHLVPNTRFTATWAAYPTAGAAPVTSQASQVSYQDTTQDWRTVTGKIVTVHWYDGTEAFAQRALQIGEQAISDTADLLGVTESEPVDFFIYADQDAFRNALGPGTRENVGGEAHSEIRTLFALITPGEINDPWVGIVIPHELVHLVFDTAVDNPYRFPPRWFNEGLAVYLSEGYTRSDQGLVSQAVTTRDLMPLDALTGQFPTEFNLTALAYAESASAIDYLVRTYGQPALVTLVTAYKDGLTDDEAFTRALGVDLATFQTGWLGELGARPPQRYGPQPAPPGPVPDDWQASPPTGAVATPAVADATRRPASASPVAARGGGDGELPLVAGLIALIGLGSVAVALVIARRRTHRDRTRP
jgi:hypothetical protein